MTPRRAGTPLLAFRAGALGPLVDERVGTREAGTRAQVVRRDLARYYRLLAEGTVELSEQWPRAVPGYVEAMTGDEELVPAVMAAARERGMSPAAVAALIDGWERKQTMDPNREAG